MESKNWNRETLKSLNCLNTVDYVACSLLNALMKWCIDISKVAAIATNNKSNIVSVVAQTFGQNKHIACFAHTINLWQKIR